ncbi:MAG: hypothetical protein ACKPHU_03525, partial [Planctomycetaceae bacterium]
VQGMFRGRDLSVEESSACIGVIMDGQADGLDIAAFLTALSMKGLRASELSGAAAAMRARSAQIKTRRYPLIDTCGTGGDELQTFNISTAAAIVLSACGAAVELVVNRSRTSPLPLACSTGAVLWPPALAGGALPAALQPQTAMVLLSTAPHC